MSVKSAERFGNQEESKLLACLKSANALIESGESPNAALAKAAKDTRLHPDSVPLAVQAYNVGRQTYQREKCAKQGTECLLGEYPIAKQAAVESIMFPEASDILKSRKEAAYHGVSSDYSNPPQPLPKYVTLQREKTASAELSALPGTKSLERRIDPTFASNQRIRAKQAADLAIRNLELKLISSHDELFKKVAALGSWCRRNSSMVPEAEWNSIRIFGTGARELFDAASVGLTGLKRASAVVHTKIPVDTTVAPYSLVKDALQKTIDYLEDEKAVKSAKDKIASEVALMLPFGRQEEGPSPILFGKASASSMPQKEAAGFLGGVMQAGIGSSLKDVLSPKKPSEITQGLERDLVDPGQEAELRAAKSKAMLSDLMTNDEVISGYAQGNPGEVTNAYNELVELNPHISDKYGLVRSALRTRLSSGQLQPFEAEQLRKIDQSYAPKEMKTKVEM